MARPIASAAQAAASDAAGTIRGCAGQSLTRTLIRIMHPFRRLPRAGAILFFAALVSLAALPGTSTAALVDAVEFYHAGFDHYFVTASADEINKLDTGVFQGWQRTGLSFKVADPSTVAPTMSPVCRFYGLPSAGLDSHFYSASPAECDEVRQRFAGAWLFESDNVFKVGLPDATTGQCPSGTVPIYRAWNKRVDSNHRYTTDASVQQSMIGKGYVAEGYGSPANPVAMCSPVVDPAARPACSIVSSNGFPVAGSTITLTATCSGGPTSFAWTNCSSITSACSASFTSPGTVSYSVVASNGNGASAPATISITWQAPPPPEAAPFCTLNLTKQTDPPVVGDLVTIVAYCNGNPTSFTWTGCVTSSNVCRLRGQAVGSQTISVAGSNSGGTGNTASVGISWVASPPPPVGMCNQFPSALYSEVGSDNATVYSTFVADPPAFAWNGAWALRFTVPGSATTGQFGSLSAAEFNGPPTFREVTVSYTACDFRPTDPTGVNGPFGRAAGNSATLSFRIGSGTPSLAGLFPGQTYYFNIRNYIPGNGTVSCSAAQQRCDALAAFLLPR
jgi:hypothetical protein